MSRIVLVLVAGCLCFSLPSCDVFLDDPYECKPDCTGRECGPDPRCDQSCGSCNPGETCSLSGRCVTSEEDGGTGEEPEDGTDAGDDAGSPDADGDSPDGGSGDEGDMAELSCEELAPDCLLPASDTNLQGVDLDGDGWGICCDCNEGDKTIHPFHLEDTEDGKDNDCNGLTDEPGGLMIELASHPGVWIDVYEVGVFEFPDCSGLQFGVESYDFPTGIPGVPLYTCSLPGIVPSAHLTWHMARAFCEAQGKRLCTAEEWSAACGETDAICYPYGQEFQQGVCNDAIGGRGESAPTGAYPDCRSGQGTYDQSGNLHEWLFDWSAESPRAALVGGYGYACEICTEQATAMQCIPCNLDDPDQVVLIETLHGCHVEDTSIHRHLRDDIRPWLGTRCCLDGP